MTAWFRALIQPHAASADPLERFVGSAGDPTYRAARRRVGSPLPTKVAVSQHTVGTGYPPYRAQPDLKTVADPFYSFL
jgi:hypothetical protein